jgi:hypothetical protein
LVGPVVSSSLIFGTCLFCASVSFTQLVKDPETWLNGGYSFKESEVLRFGQSQLHGTFVVREGKRVFQKTEGFAEFCFNPQGNIESSTVYKPYLSFADSIAQYFYYNEESLPTTIWKYDQRGYAKTKWDYQNGKAVQESQFLGLNDGREMLSNAYRIEHTLQHDTTTIESWYYVEGNLCQKIIIDGDAKDFPVKKTIISYPNEDTTFYRYFYNYRKIQSINIKKGREEYHIQVNYDVQAEVESLKMTKNDNPFKEIQFVYGQTGHNLSSVIFYDSAVNRMEILKF